jgi:hypothetical protein
MPNPEDTRRHEQVHRLTLELQALRGRLNDTIDQLCQLVAGHDIGGEPVGLSPLAGQDQGNAERSLTPGWLRLPSASASASNPPSGHRLGSDTALNSDYRNGFIQVIQVNQPRGADEQYALVVNHADYDGSFLSIVLDARCWPTCRPARHACRWRSRCAALGAGGARQCAWKVGEHWSECALRLSRPAGCRQPGDRYARSVADQRARLPRLLSTRSAAAASRSAETAGLVVTPQSEAPLTYACSRRP